MQDPRHTPAWKRLRLECYRRDKERNAVCVHCGQPIDYKAKPSSTDDSYEPDHRLVVERHPELVESVVFPPNLDDDSRVVSVQSPTTTFVTKKTMSVRERELARN